MMSVSPKKHCSKGNVMQSSCKPECSKDPKRSLFLTLMFQITNNMGNKLHCVPKINNK